MPVTFVGPEFERPLFELETKIAELKDFASTKKMDFSAEVRVLEEKYARLMQEIYSSLTPWQRVQIARHPRRPYTLDYVRLLIRDFIPLAGDRTFAEDPALIGGIGFFEDEPVLIIGHQKGREVQESMVRNFGMPHPEGYRKALRLMKLAEKFNLSVIAFIDTPGAYPGIGAEERGQAEAIARNLREMVSLRVPVICLVIGEGGSGGALAIGVGNRLLMLENAWYSVISPEGCAAILFRDAAKAEEAAVALKLTAEDLLRLGIIDEIIPEPLGGTHRDINTTGENIRLALRRNLQELRIFTPEQLVEQRYQKYRCIGSYRQEIQKELDAAVGERKKCRSRNRAKT